MVKIVGSRTFTRIEDSKGELLAYVGGSPDRQRVAAHYIVKLFEGESEDLLQTLEKLQEENRKLKDFLKEAVKLTFALRREAAFTVRNQELLQKCLDAIHED